MILTNVSDSVQLVYTMRNDISTSKKIISLAEKLPYFGVENLRLADVEPDYLKTILSRQAKKGEFIRIKKGLYTTKSFIERIKAENKYSLFLESLASEAYSPSYLSLEYILYQNNILTESPINFTLVTKNKTADFSNQLGNFIYHKIKDDLFLGFKAIKEQEFSIYKATKAKALFDFLYIRKNLLINRETIKELRLNLEEMLPKDIKELKGYVKSEGSAKMKKIYGELGIN